MKNEASVQQSKCAYQSYTIQHKITFNIKKINETIEMLKKHCGF